MEEETRRVCRNCGTPLAPGARFCEECGTDAEAPAAAAAEVKTHGDQTPINVIRAREAEQNRNPAPQPGRDPAPNPGYNPMPNPGYNPTPNPGYNPTPNPGYNPTPNPGYNPTPNPGYNPTPNPGYNQTPNPGYNQTPNPGYNQTPNPGYNPTPNPGYDSWNGWNPPPKKNNNKTWLFVAIGAVAVVAIALIIIIVVIKPGAQQGSGTQQVQATTPENAIVGTWYSYMAVDTSNDSMSTLDRNVWVLTINAGGTAQSSINGVVTEGRWSYVATNESGNYTYQYQDASGSFQMVYVLNGNEVASTGDVWMQVGTTVVGFKR